MRFFSLKTTVISVKGKMKTHYPKKKEQKLFLNCVWVKRIKIGGETSQKSRKVLYQNVSQRMYLTIWFHKD